MRLPVSDKRLPPLILDDQGIHIICNTRREERHDRLLVCLEDLGVKSLPMLTLQSSNDVILPGDLSEAFHKSMWIQVTTGVGDIGAQNKWGRRQQAEPSPVLDGPLGSTQGTGNVTDRQQRDRLAVDRLDNRTTKILDFGGHGEIMATEPPIRIGSSNLLNIERCALCRRL